MNRKVYLMNLCPSPNHILPKQGQWSCEQPLKNSGRLVIGVWEEIANIHTDRWADRQMGRQTDGQTDRRADRQMGRQTDGQTDRRADRQTGRQTGRQTDRQTGRQTDRWADRQTEL